MSASGLYRSDTNCGACGNDCTAAIAGGVGRCGGPLDAPVCVVSVCDAGLVPVSAFACGKAIVPTCEPCGSDADCGGAGGVCASVAGVTGLRRDVHDRRYGVRRRLHL